MEKIVPAIELTEVESNNIKELMKEREKQLLFAYQPYLISSSKGCVSAECKQACFCAQLAPYLTSSKITHTDYQ